ncbi:MULTISPECIES: fructose-specific PTS transporter subunit EIIC [unclassified Cryobacterium]|uniref:fructose-specific PTS transporter subunit EIIC n=1 Tax=unclassified Cryobacterium TaxID=2649013 RepID=UPI002AB35347|nr:MULTISPECIES: fructose-specific PTS transporter subunit EIIC [unclassified Cryobacterium]MDY7544601.1 fructose-specific PTS transporter subunit EIIC [Cryobacterium sp. 5B3]MEB0000096.1 fructose-specific PTS transporter subunit EIIC [Cryobacterium sp. RTS3]MEB0266765.1 fructose-specific PTS transporter subunit EIIC [Cryobacterium sp. 10I5]MEB0275961.1 fructose-specific PTS transporter subunit EIIC [Cryobacterium sp. 5B3]
MSQPLFEAKAAPPSILILGITACPTGIAHTYMAAEKLESAAAELGYEMKVETHGSVGVEGTFSQDDIDRADAIVIAADTKIDRSRFAGKRIISTRVADGIHRPAALIRDALAAEPSAAGERSGRETAASSSGTADFGGTLYRALMNGVSYMIPFVVVGGLLIAISLSLGGEATPKGLVIPEGSFWLTLNQIGVLGFTLMVPILSGFIAYAIADRPGLAPGMICGWIATTGAFYHSESGAGFIGGIVTGFLVGFVALGIKKIPVHRFIKPIMPILVIPVLTTVIVGGAFVLALGQPISWVFSSMTTFLTGLQGGSVIILGLILGAMVAFDMGGPVNKTAFLFGSALIASGNPAPMGMVAAAIAVPPLGMGLATLIRGRYFSKPEREAGIAALFMGFFGITEGAIPLAAAKPLQVIPANMIGGAVAGGIAALFGVTDSVPHGGPIVAIFGAVSGVPMYFAALLIGAVVTALVSVLLLGLSTRRAKTPVADAGTDDPATPGPVPASVTPAKTILDYIDERTIMLDADETDRDAMIHTLAGLMIRTGRVTDEALVTRAALAREEHGTTGIGDGIAIPHAKSNGVTAPVLAFARSTQGIDWDSADGSMATLIFMIAVPEAAAGTEHLKVLAQLSRALMKPAFRTALRSAATSADVLAALAAQVGPKTATPAAV